MLLAHFERFVSDVRAGRRWMLGTAASVLIIGMVTSYMAIFTASGLRDGTLSAGQPHAPVSFLRSLDAEESIGVDASETSDSDPSGLDQLFELMKSHPEIFMVLPMDAFTADAAMRSDAPSTDAYVAVGTDIPFISLDIPKSSERGLLWGSVDGGSEGDASDPHLLSIPLDTVEDAPIDFSFISGAGTVRESNGAALIAISPDAALALGVARTFRPSEAVGSVTCYCNAHDLSSVASVLTDAAKNSGHYRAYYALDYDGLIGPVQRSASLSEAFDLAQGVAALVSILLLSAMTAQALLKRRESIYRVELLCGATEFGLHSRIQGLLAICLTIPLIVSLEVTNAVVAGGAWPVPLSLDARLTTYGAILILQTLAAVPAMTQVRAMSRRPLNGARIG